MKLDEAEAAVKKALQDCSGDSSAFKLKDMKSAYAEKKKEQAKLNGLDPDTLTVAFVTELQRLH